MTEVVTCLEVIETLKQLEILESSLPDSQLRFISGTSLNRTFGAICIVFDKEIDSVLLVPYFIKKSHEQLDALPISENPESLALRLIVKEAELQSKKVHVLGSPIDVQDRKNEDQKFYKYVVLFTDFAPEDRVKIEKNSNKNGKPVWVKRSLLDHVFESEPIVKDIPRKHPHKEAYQRFIEVFPLRKDLER